MTEAVEEFTSRVNDYVALRNRLADSVGPLSENMTQEQIAARATALSQAILLARPDARQGDIFTPRAASVFGALIEQEYSRRPPRVREVREDAQDELPDFVPKVNQLYPTTYPLATFPPELLPLLPRLPEEVEYRVVNHYLLLRDVESNLIVDFMPRAVPVPKA
ncbi:MAG TPA: hypothetical protein VFO95_15860 [Gemmatimonadales bacterium]|nr:hypothetical protein [Gemmatimonadales bacterium]